MSLARGILSAALAATMLVIGCSSNSTPQGAGSDAPSVSSTDTNSAKPSARKSTTARSSSKDPTPSSSAAAAKKRKTTNTASASKDDSWLDIAVRAIPTCASVGDKVRIDVTTTPQAHLSISVFYADRITRASHGAGYADSKGRFIHAFQISPGAVPGDAKVSAVGSLDTKKRKAAGVGRTYFTVAPPGACG